MKKNQDGLRESACRWGGGCLVGVVLACGGDLSAQELFTPPASPAEEIFSPLKETSPFQRTLDIGETYALRGVARVDGVSLATVFNKETKKTVVVTPDTENDAGLKLVEVVPGRELEGVTAKVSFAGEVAELRYDAEQIQPRPAPGDNRGSSNGDRRGSGGDGERRGPSKEDMERYRSLSEDQQAKFRAYVGEIVRKYPDMPREERGAMIRGALVRLSENNDLPSNPGGGSNSGDSQNQRGPSMRGGGDSRGGGGDSRGGGGDSRSR